MFKLTINKRQVSKKGIALLVLAGTIAINTIAFTGYKVVEHVAHTVVADVVATEEVTIAWDTEVPSVVAAIESVNGELNGPKMKQAINEFHNLNNTWSLEGHMHDIKAGTYTVPVIK